MTERSVGQFDVDSAAVGLIEGNEEEFISCHGASFDAIDREDAVRTYTFLEDDVTVVEDTRTDPRLSDIEGLRDAGVRFYAGAPMLTPERYAIGVFCLHDDEPRQCPDRARKLLQLYADEAIERLELRRRAADRREGQVME